jgi:uncharacterized protein (DUF1501 family)
MLVLDGMINGGSIYGSFPGLSDAQLFQNTDLAVTTDFRTVISEIISVKLGNPNIDQVFPGFTNYTPIGLYPEFPIFSSDFES